jgi:hypothetical protein
MIQAHLKALTISAQSSWLTMSEYTHNDDMADLLHEKDIEIRDLKKQVSKLLMHLEYVRAEISRLETEHYRGV